MKPQVVHLPSLNPKECPCGEARRAFTDLPGAVASVHVVDIKKDSQVHYHKKMTEIYVVIEGNGFIEIDGETFPISPLTAIYIPPNCRHRAIGKLKILNIPIPPFDPSDEWID